MSKFHVTPLFFCETEASIFFIKKWRPGRCPPRPLPPPAALRRPFRGDALARHITGDSGCARFVIGEGGDLPTFLSHHPVCEHSGRISGPASSSLVGLDDMTTTASKTTIMVTTVQPSNGGGGTRLGGRMGGTGRRSPLRSAVVLRAATAAAPLLNPAERFAIVVPSPAPSPDVEVDFDFRGSRTCSRPPPDVLAARLMMKELLI